MGDIKTKESLLRALQKAAKRGLDAETLHKQRVSFIMGSLNEKSGVTRAHVEKVLARQEGRRKG